LSHMSSRGSIARVVVMLASALLLSLVFDVGVAVPALAAQAPTVEEQWVAEVSTTSAKLQARVNPGEATTTYRFEYATSEAALLAGEGEVFPAPPTLEGAVGAGSEGVVVEGRPQGLQPHTDYWYRVLVKNGEGETPGCQTPDSCLSFTTQSAGGESELPDGRRWELVSPAVKDGALITPSPEGGGLVQAAEDGGAITYLSGGPAKTGLEAPAGNSNETQILSIRGTGGGWSSQDIATPHEVSTGISVGQGQEYRWFSPNLAVGLVEPFGSGTDGEEPEGSAPLSEAASEKTIYLRADTSLPPESGTSEQALDIEADSEGGYLPLVTGCPVNEAECGPKVRARANVPPGTEFGGKMKFVSATADLDHVVLHSSVPLAPAAKGHELYEWTAGASPGEQLKAVSVLPKTPPYNGEHVNATLGGPEEPAGTQSKDVSGAISSDGSRIVWSYKGHIFMRDTSSEQTIQIDLPEAGAEGGAGEAEFGFASSDGSKVFFADGARLTTDSTAEPGKPDLYMCEIVEEADEGIKCDLRDLTVDSGGSANVQGIIVPSSDESSYVYFVANGALTKEANAEGEVATPGQCGATTCNLYVRHYNEASKEWEAPVFIASLSSEDRPDWSGTLEQAPARVSPDGEYLEFMSDRSLTHNDNKDVSSGEPDEEVYLYRAPSADADAPSGRLACVSCNPTGERPAGVHDPTGEEEGLKGLLVDTQRIWGGHRLAGSVPGWTAMRLEDARYQSRYVSGHGRVFFNSSDALVPQATNGLMDVYEYEPVGVGSCEPSSGTFSKRSGGCVGLISSGSSGEESAFLDASASGEDVFFLTSAQLVSADKDTAFDVYDAHVCGALAPCFTEALAPPPCATVDACRAAPTPQPSIFGSPSSATFLGPGDVTAAPSLTAPVVKPKAKPATCRKGSGVKKHGKCAKKRKAKKAKRAGNERRASR
jgi:hypothetical protein